MKRGALRDKAVWSKSGAGERDRMPGSQSLVGLKQIKRLERLSVALDMEDLKAAARDRTATPPAAFRGTRCGFLPEHLVAQAPPTPRGVATTLFPRALPVCRVHSWPRTR